MWHLPCHHRTVRVQIILFEGFDELDVFGPFEPLASSGVTVELVRLDGPGVVTSARGVRVETTETFLSSGANPVDGIVIPGGGWLNRAPEGAWAQVQRGDLPGILAARQDEVGWVASVCSGGMILAHAGLLDGHRATTNRACFDEFAPLVGELVDARVVDDGDVITAGALSCGLDLGIHLVRRFLGDETADALQAGLEYPPKST